MWLDLFYRRGTRPRRLREEAFNATQGPDKGTRRHDMDQASPADGIRPGRREKAVQPVSRTFRSHDGLKRPWTRTRSQEFRCRHCRMFVGALPSGGKHRNHCPSCLYSRHVDGDRPGDRASACGGSMAPIGAYERPSGEHVIVHRCWDCGQERDNRIAADDDFRLVLRLPPVAPYKDRIRIEEPLDRTA
jgi:hypothetical protein